MRILSIIAQKGFQDIEYAESRKAIEGAGIKVDVASVSASTAVGKLGANVKPDLAIKDADMSKYDAIMIIGGPGAPELGNHPEIFKLLKQAEDSKKVIAAICIAPVILAKGEFLKYKKATVWNGDGLQSAFIERAGAIYTGEEVTVDGLIVTGDGPDAAAKFGKAVADLVLKEKQRK